MFDQTCESRQWKIASGNGESRKERLGRLVSEYERGESPGKFAKMKG